MAEEHGKEQCQTTTSPAAERVFNVPELLEKILLSMDDRIGTLKYGIQPRFGTRKPERLWGNAVKDLYIVQRVNQMFKAVIENSPQLRRVMLLEHDAALSGSNGRTGFRLFGMHLLLHRVDNNVLGFHPAIPCHEPDCYEFCADGGQNGIARERLLLEFTDIGTYVGCTCVHGAHMGDARIYDARSKTKCLSLNHRASRTPKGGLAPGASWRLMLLCNRPTDVVLEVEFDLKDPQNDSNRRRCTYSQLLHIDEGMATLGDLYDMLEKMNRRSLVDHRRTAKEIRDTIETLEAGLHGKNGADSVKELQRAEEKHYGMMNCGRREGDCHYCNAVASLYTPDEDRYARFVEELEEERRAKREAESGETRAS